MSPLVLAPWVAPALGFAVAGGGAVLWDIARRRGIAVGEAQAAAALPARVRASIEAHKAAAAAAQAEAAKLREIAESHTVKWADAPPVKYGDAEPVTMTIQASAATAGERFRAVLGSQDTPADEDLYDLRLSLNARLTPVWRQKIADTWSEDSTHGGRRPITDGKINWSELVLDGRGSVVADEVAAFIAATFPEARYPQDLPVQWTLTGRRWPRIRKVQPAVHTVEVAVPAIQIVYVPTITFDGELDTRAAGDGLDEASVRAQIAAAAELQRLVRKG